LEISTFESGSWGVIMSMHTRETDVLDAQKPLVMQLFERWVIVSVIFWLVLSSIYGIIYVGITEGIALPLMALFMFFAGRWMMFIMLIVQKRNSAISRKLWDFEIYFFWGGCVFSFFYFLVSGIFTSEENYTYFLIAASPFVLGPALGASKMWEQRFEYK
jgi:hypothetical protein